MAHASSGGRELTSRRAEAHHDITGESCSIDQPRRGSDGNLQFTTPSSLTESSEGCQSPPSAHAPRWMLANAEVATTSYGESPGASGYEYRELAGQTTDADEGSGRRRRRHRSRTAITSVTGARGSGDSPLTSHRRSKSVNDQSVIGESVTGKKEATFSCTSTEKESPEAVPGRSPGRGSSHSHSHNHSHSVSPSRRPRTTLMSGDTQLTSLGEQRIAQDMTASGDAAIAKGLHAQGGHVGRTVKRRVEKVVSAPSGACAVSRRLPALILRRSFSDTEEAAARTAAEVVQQAAGRSSSQQRRRDQAALRCYIKAFRVENGRPPTSVEDWRPMTRTRARLEELAEDLEKKLGQVRSAKDGERVEAKHAKLKSLQECIRFLPVQRGLNAELTTGQDAQADDLTAGSVIDPQKPVLPSDVGNGITESGATEARPDKVTKRSSRPSSLQRLRLRRVLESSQCEAMMLLLMVVYGLIVLCGFGVEGLHLHVWEHAYLVIDVVFLSLFMIEITLHICAFGLHNSNISAPQVIYTAAITISFAAIFIEVEGGSDSDGQEGAADNDNRLRHQVAAMLQFLRIGRLLIVVMRIMKTFVELMAKRTEGEVDPIGNYSFDHTFLGSYRKAREVFNWSPTAEYERVTSVDLEKLESLVQHMSPHVVHVLTDDFSTVLACVHKLDKNRDGKIIFDELKPMLAGIFKDAQLVTATRALFETLDINHDGFITAAELYAARVGLKYLIEQHAKANQHSGAQAGDQAMNSHHEKRFWERTHISGVERYIGSRRRWWTSDRWKDNLDLVELRRTRDERGNCVYSKASALLWDRLRSHLGSDTYQFKPGVVDVMKHIEGSGALLEFRIDQIVRNLADCKHEVAELSQKLQEIEVGQPMDAIRHRTSLTTYSTFLKGLSAALPAACLRMQPFANYDSDVGVSWHALRPRPGVDGRVHIGAIGLSVGMTLTTLLCLAYIFVVSCFGAGGFTHLQLRRACEETWVPAFDIEAVENRSAVAYAMQLGTCAQVDGPLGIFRLSVLFPAAGILTLCMSPLIFWGNVEATALLRLLRDPDTLILLLQAIAKAGLDTINLSRFPVAVRIYSINVTGGMMLLGRLAYLLFLLLSIFIYVMTDVCVVPAPRMRCVFGMALLVLMLCEQWSYLLELPTMVELRDDVLFQLARRIDFSLLAILAGALVSTLTYPLNLAFVHLPTNLSELLLFDTGLRQQKAVQLAALRKYSNHTHALQQSLQTRTRDASGEKFLRVLNEAKSASASVLNEGKFAQALMERVERRKRDMTSGGDKFLRVLNEAKSASASVLNEGKFVRALIEGSEYRRAGRSTWRSQNET